MYDVLMYVWSYEAYSYYIFFFFFYKHDQHFKTTPISSTILYDQHTISKFDTFENLYPFFFFFRTLYESYKKIYLKETYCVKKYTISIMFYSNIIQFL
jgi:hypothetical protein